MGAVLDLVRVLFEPTAAFERVREKPRFLAPFLALAVLTMAITALQLPYTKAALAVQFAATPNMTPEQTQTGMKFAAVGVVIAPIFFGLFLVINALILWVSTSVLGGEGKFATLLSVTTYASITYTLLQVIGVIVLTMRARARSRACWTCSRHWGSICSHPTRRASRWAYCAASTHSRCTGCS